MEQENVIRFAHVLHEARLARKSVPYLSLSQKFSAAEAYAIQEKQLEMRLANGETQIGWKMGLTSEAKRKQMNLFSPLYGHLTDRMRIPNESAFSMDHNIHPKIEPEIAFEIQSELKGAVSREDVLQACSGVAAALEILDTRYEAFKYFSLEDVIADNSSSSYFAVGPWRRDRFAIDLLNLKMTFTVDGKVAHEASSREISGDPVASVQQLCLLLAERGQSLKKGSIVLAGAATPAVELQNGMNISLTVSGLEPVDVKIRGGL